jgi:ATP-dependent RNA helicase DDX3X
MPELDNSLRDNLKKMKFNLMTPIQKAVIPFLYKGHDVMGCSQTGSGKTIAFLLPIIHKMLKEGPPPENRNETASCPVCLIIIPTRELAEQIYREARKLVHRTGINIVKVYGGVPHEGQIR